MNSNSSSRIRLNYTLVRNLTSPEEQDNGSKCFIAVCPLSEVLKFDTSRNLRDYIPAHDAKKRNPVHKLIQATLQERSDRFIQYNGGLTIACSEIEIKDGEKVAVVSNGSIINGAQTQGEIKRFLDEIKNQTGEDVEIPEINARVEFVVEPDDGQVTEIAIARNTSTDIKRLTMAGARSYFVALDESFRKIHNSLKLAKNETDLIGDDYVDTGKLLQILWLLCPSELLDVGGARSISDARLKSYKNRNQCLLDFEDDVNNSKKPNPDPRAKDRYQCFIDLAGPAWSEYQKWQQHQAWAKKYLKGIKQIKRSKDGHTVADGIIFPILSAMSEFVKKNRDGRWVIEVPNIFDDEAMIDAAREQLTSNKGQPMLMARTSGVYAALALIPKGYKRMLERASVVVR